MEDSRSRALRYAAIMKKYRKIQNMSQENLSQNSGINVSTIKKYETGNRIPKYEQLEKIAAALGINVNDFYETTINTTGELLSAIISIENQTDMIISGKMKKDGSYDPDTIELSFRDKDINELLSKYLEYKDSIKENKTSSEESDELEALILTDTPIKKSNN